jgi:very-short-patch-repair endonuclease/endogenous inhibitor of DNA gyrase (YacG/DUF329 family)
MKSIILECGWCGKPFKKELKEVVRQWKKGREMFYCSTSCAAKKGNEHRKAPEIEKTCPVCNKIFKTVSNKHERTFCSPSCASSGSMTDARWEAVRKLVAGGYGKENLISPEEVLKKREAWKYINVKKHLENLNENFEFEYRMKDYIYDLALIDKKIFIEFDGPDHDGLVQVERDLLKNKVANKNGWQVKRIAVDSNSVINIDKELLK